MLHDIDQIYKACGIFDMPTTFIGTVKHAIRLGVSMDMKIKLIRYGDTVNYWKGETRKNSGKAVSAK